MTTRALPLILDGAERSSDPFATRPHHDSRSVDDGERSDPAGTPAGDQVGAGCPPCGTADMPIEKASHIVIAGRLKQAGEWLYSRGRVDHPCFKSARVAAENLLRLLLATAPLLVMRDQCLRPLREFLLELDRPLLCLNKLGDCPYRIPRSALYTPDGRRVVAALRVEPLPYGAEPYVGAVGAVIVGCLAFDPHSRRLYSFDGDRTAAVLDEMLEGLASGFRLRPDTPVIALAHDCQEVTDWPDAAFGFVQADLVVTPTRAVMLGTGESHGMDAGGRRCMGR